MATDPRAAQLVTLPRASELVGHPKAYFTLRRARWLKHDVHPFPLPVAEIAGKDVYDFQALVVWDAARKRRDAERREIEQRGAEVDP